MRHGICGLVGTLGLCLLAGCSTDGGANVGQRPIDSPEATETTNARIEEMLTGMADATDQLDTSDSTSIASDGLSGALGDDRCGNTTSSSSLGSSASKSVDSVPRDTTESLGKLIRQVRDEAKEHVFREDLVESKDGNQVVYKVNPAQACKENTNCVTKLTENPVRFAVTANADNSLNVAMLVGQERHTPASAVLSDRRIAVRGNFSEVMDAVRLFTDAEQQKDFPDKFAGTVEFAVEKRGEGNFALSASVLEKFELAVGQSKGKPVSITIQPNNPTTEITLNSVTNAIGYSLNLGAVDVSAAGTAVCTTSMHCGSKEQAGTFSMHLAGVTGAFEATAGANELTFNGLGLGSESSYLAANGQRLATVDVNPNAGRKFSMNFKKTAEGTLVTFEPALDLKIAVAMTNLSESMRVDMPDWLLDEVFDVTLGGAPKPSVLVPAPTCSATGNAESKQQLKVVSGKLGLTSTSLSSQVEVIAGMCLTATESSEETPNPFSLLKSSTCQ